MALYAILIAAAFAQPNTKNVEVGVATSYVRGGGFDGPGIAVQSLWSPNDYFALGPMIDVAYVSTGSLTAGNGLPASYAFISTLAAGMVQLRLPMRLVEPFADLALGYVGVSGRRSVNTQCGLSSGFGALLAIGGRAAVSDRLTLGIRGSARSSSLEQTCELAFGPAIFDVPLLFALSSTLDYRW
jgi:hypothetical protein